MSEPVLLVIDIGNTNVSLGVFDYRDAGGAAELVHHWRVSTHREQTSDELGVMLRALFQQDGIAPDSVTDVIMSDAMGKPVSGSFNLDNTIPELASVLDGDEKLIAILDIPVRVRKTFYP